MNIVFLDTATIIYDLNLSIFDEIGTLKCYDRTASDDVIKHIGNADAIFLTKVKIDKNVLDNCPNLKFIGVAATGFNNVDISECKKRGIAVTNVPAYSTDSVAQHTFALLLEISNHVALHNKTVHEKKWCDYPDFSYVEKPILLLKNKSLGIIGYGSIGKKVANIAKAFNMNINIYSRDKESTLKSDFISLHCPATPDNIGFVNKDFINNMKKTAVLINTARGSLVNEADLADALNNDRIKAYGTDVLSTEPPSPENPLLTSKNTFITPHIAWTPLEMREIIIKTLYDNLLSFTNGGTINRVES